MGGRPTPLPHPLLPPSPLSPLHSDHPSLAQASVFGHMLSLPLAKSRGSRSSVRPETLTAGALRGQGVCAVPSKPRCSASRPQGWDPLSVSPRLILSDTGEEPLLSRAGSAPAGPEGRVDSDLRLSQSHLKSATPTPPPMCYQPSRRRWRRSPPRARASDVGPSHHRQTGSGMQRGVFWGRDDLSGFLFRNRRGKVRRILPTELKL